MKNYDRVVKHKYKKTQNRFENMKNNIVIIIPARMASNRLPGKPLANIGNKTMIQHVVESALSADFAPVYVACDDEEIAESVKKAGGQAVLTATFHPTGTDRIYEAIEKIDRKKKFNTIINLQGDLPFIQPEVLKKLAGLFKNPDTLMATPVVKIIDPEEIMNPSVVKVALSMENDKTAKALYFSRSPVPYNAEEYYHHIGIYGYRREILEKFVSLPTGYLENIEKLEQLRALENNIPIDITIVDKTSISVDTLEDLERARAYFIKISQNI